MDNTQAAGSTAEGSSAPAQPTSGQASSLPQGHRAVSESDYGRFQRYEQQVKGFSPYGERFAKYGITKPEDLDAHFANRNGQGQEQAQAPASSPQAYDPETVNKAVQAAIARERHTESRKGEGSLIKNWAKKLAGEDADDFAVEDAEHYLRANLSNLRDDPAFEANFYPAGHPLREETFAPYSDAHFEKLAPTWQERITKREAARMQQTAQAASKPSRPRPSPSGSSGGQGKPETSNQSRSAGEHIDDIVDRVLAGRT
jgi:hypothetical protein